jgi:two-component system cell cycle sensor histidine kinase PleC
MTQWQRYLNPPWWKIAGLGKANCVITGEIASADERQAKLTLDQLALALRNLRPNHYLMPVFAAVICVMFSRWIVAARLEIWFALLVLSVIPLGVVSYGFRRRAPEPSAAKVWVWRATVAYGVFAVGWASMGYFLWAPAGDLNHLLIIMLLACTLAGNAALAGASKPLSIAALAIYGTALVVTPLRAGDLLYGGISVLAVVFVFYLGYMASQIYNTARDMLLLRNDKSDLIVALAQAKTESDGARERAEAANRAKSQFLANMSHELRTPLNAILGFSELIESRAFATNAEKHFEYAGMIHDSGQHLLTLINDILDLARIEAGSLVLQETEVDLAILIADVVRLLTHRAETSGSRLRVETAADLPNLFADERALKQILLNLVSNAVKFTPEGGTVDVFAELEPGGGICFGVSDTGIGIAEEDQARVFQNFGQGRHDVAITDKGTGLGLPIAKGLAEAHGADIALHSRVGHGTRVTVSIPPERSRPKNPLRAAS